jgi:hypothetical protein
MFPTEKKNFKILTYESLNNFTGYSTLQKSLFSKQNLYNKPYKGINMTNNESALCITHNSKRTTGHVQITFHDNQYPYNLRCPT